jgi:hypothetical protein
MLDFAVKITRAFEECQPSELARQREFGYTSRRACCLRDDRY